MSYLELPFFNESDLDKLEHYKQNILNFEKQLDNIKKAYEKQENVSDTSGLEQEIKNINQNIANLKRQIQNILARVKLNVIKSIKERLKELSPEKEEYKLLIKLNNDLNEVQQNHEIDYQKMLHVYNEYQLLKERFFNRNKEIIVVLQNKLRELENNFNQSQNMSGLDITTSSDGTIILKNDLEEYNNIVEMIKMLQDLDLEMVPLGENIYLKQEHLKEFERLASKTSFLKRFFPEPTTKEVDLVERVASMTENTPSMAVDSNAQARIEERVNTLNTEFPNVRETKVIMPSKKDLADALSDKNILFQALDQYIAAKKENNITVMIQTRNFIMKMTGINIDDYFILKKDLDEVRKSIVEYLSMSPDDYIAHLREVIDEFQMFIDEGLLPSRETTTMEHDITLLYERISEVEIKKRR